MNPRGPDGVRFVIPSSFPSAAFQLWPPAPAFFSAYVLQDVALSDRLSSLKLAHDTGSPVVLAAYAGSTIRDHDGGPWQSESSLRRPSLGGVSLSSRSHTGDAEVALCLQLTSRSHPLSYIPFRLAVSFEAMESPNIYDIGFISRDPAAAILETKQPCACTQPCCGPCVRRPCFPEPRTDS
jgi:hypothetical protein